MKSLARRVFARALIVLVPLAELTTPAAAQFGLQPPTGPATAPCLPFSGFPMAFNFGQRADGLDGISSRCGFQRMQDGLNTIAGQKGQPGGIATLNAAGWSRLPRSRRRWLCRQRCRA
ncbi:hypothetical protein ACQKQD_31490 [Methylobacterium sp. NPDC080182]|uniref:hypothetical protein n=1 Tax=Methylobacterium sp. NPDC080182 TaxID=3390590 RepID=UPI003D0485E6